MKIYNGENMILGRLAARVAKDILLGEEVAIVNCNKVVISGRKTNTFATQKNRIERKGHPLAKVQIPRLPDRFVRRSVRGMIPWKKPRGKEAFRRVMCYNTIPSELEGKELITLADANINKLSIVRYITIQDLCKSLGGKQ